LISKRVRKGAGEAGDVKFVRKAYSLYLDFPIMKRKGDAESLGREADCCGEAAT